jgi:hypothetical protein
MDAKSFNNWISDLLNLPPKARHRKMADRHTAFLQEYARLLLSVSDERAEEMPGSEGRSLTQLVGLQAAWDRFRLAGAMDLLLGVYPPRSLQEMRGYVDLDGRKLEFISVDEFIRYQAEQQADWTWAQAREFGLQSAGSLQAFFTHPHLLSVQVLEAAPPAPCELPGGRHTDALPMGWCFWITSLRQYLVEHKTRLEGLLAD